jgi:septal ring factor EnvC (AmiA/AmiB activator)
MSEERLERIENQLERVIQAITGMQQSIVGLDQRTGSLEQKMTSMEQNLNAVREDVSGLRYRIDSVEGTLLTAMRDGFKAQSDYADDLNYDLSVNERKTRRLSRRVTRLERTGEE